MPYEIDFQDRVVYVRLFGAVGVDELASAVSDLAVDPAFDRQRFHVVDYTDATLPPLDTHVVEAIAPVIGATMSNPDITAIVIPDNEQTRAFASFCSPMLRGLRSVRFFPDRAQADDWISRQG